jgi:hypothetical protein
MKFCPKLYLCRIILEKIVSCPFILCCHANYLFIYFLDNLALVMELLSVKLANLAKMPC